MPVVVSTVFLFVQTSIRIRPVVDSRPEVSSDVPGLTLVHPHLRRDQPPRERISLPALSRQLVATALSDPRESDVNVWFEVLCASE